MKRLSKTIFIMMAFLLFLISAGCHQSQTLRRTVQEIRFWTRMGMSSLPF